MYEGAIVYRDGYGRGVVVLSVESQGLNGVTYLLEIQFDSLNDTVSMYEDEITMEASQ